MEILNNKRIYKGVIFRSHIKQTCIYKVDLIYKLITSRIFNCFRFLAIVFLFAYITKGLLSIEEGIDQQQILNDMMEPNINIKFIINAVI
ncbi:unnamed protein product [Paramecium octaurelia]|uniref:Uncharacterized protein n=1 Tax=Paramecium octaurelia TaxID=43137 RepID=A0A8S1T6B9_PAROT|nr:unnamed protein product [Paramecium octaurelia]